MKNLFFIFLIFTCPLLAQLGGTHSFSFLQLNTSPRATALGGYLSSAFDGDINNGVYNPALINPLMNNKLGLNFTNYYSDITYGDIGYCFRLDDYHVVSSVKFIDYGQFIETNELGQQVGEFSAGEYVFSLGSNSMIDSTFYVGLNAKFAYSSLYELSSLAVFLDLGCTYIHPNSNLIASLLFKNIGYQLDTYYENQREVFPFEFLFGVSNKLEHMPLRWHLTFQHLETPDLRFDNTAQSPIFNDNTVFNAVLNHFVLGAEFLINQNVSVLMGYNNRKRSEMIIENRRGLVGFSTGFLIKIKRFYLAYSISANHLSGTVSTFGITTKLKK